MSLRGCVLYFVKVPAKGTVKSRLAEAVGADAAVEIYRRFVRDFLATLDRVSQPSVICYHPASAGRDIEAWLGPSRSYLPQEGPDLGGRMRDAFLRAFSRGFDRALLIGSDIPDLPPCVIEEAFDALRDHDAVMGPASDGGYYLIGFRRDSLVDEVFTGLTWSTGTVFSETMEIFRLRGTSVHVVQEWRDVDTIDDLRDLLERNKTGDFSDSATISLLRSLNLFSG